MKRYELLERIAKLLHNSLDQLDADKSWYNCEEEIQDQIDDMRDFLYNYEDDEDFYCKDCKFFEYRFINCIGEVPFCKFHKWKTRYLYTCPHMEKVDA